MGRGSVVSGSSKGVHTSSKKRHTILTFPKIRLCLHSTGQLLSGTNIIPDRASLSHIRTVISAISITEQCCAAKSTVAYWIGVQTIPDSLLDRCSYYTR